MESNVNPVAAKNEGKVSRAFTWFHATSVNGGTDVLPSALIYHSFMSAVRKFKNDAPCFLMKC